MRAHTTLTLALGAALAATALAAAPALALDRYEDGSRLGDAGRASSEPSRPGRAAAWGARTAADEASREPAGAAAPCPGTGSQGGVWLNGRSFNGIRFNGWSMNGKMFNGTEPAGTGEAAATGALRVTAVRLPDGRTFAAPAR